MILLPKCVLCAPPQRGHSADSGVAAYTLDRLARWEAGERMSLWNDAPAYKPVASNDSKAARKTRATALAREGLDSKACAALLSDGLARESAANASKMRALHPRA